VNVVTASRPQYKGISALLVAGVKRLNTHDEVEDTLKRILERAGQSPLGHHADLVTGLHAFIGEIGFDGLTATGYDAALEKYRKK
jgi:hypothetical protein